MRSALQSMHCRREEHLHRKNGRIAEVQQRSLVASFPKLGGMRQVYVHRKASFNHTFRVFDKQAAL